jgi:hypothetical protein
MNFAVLIISILIIASKYLDCWTTSTQITNPNQERNPIARKLFEKFGSQTVIWIIFGLTILIVGLSLLILFKLYNTNLYKVLFIIIGLIVSTSQFAVAHTNKTRRLNFITKVLMKRYGKYR